MRQRSRGIRRSSSAIVLALTLAIARRHGGAAQCPSAPSGAPPAQLTISTTYPSIAVDPGGTATFPLQVTSPTVERVDLTVIGRPEGFETTFKGGGSSWAASRPPAPASRPSWSWTSRCPRARPQVPSR